MGRLRSFLCVGLVGIRLCFASLVGLVWYLRCWTPFSVGNGVALGGVWGCHLFQWGGSGRLLGVGACCCEGYGAGLVAEVVVAMWGRSRSLLRGASGLGGCWSPSGLGVRLVLFFVVSRCDDLSSFWVDGFPVETCVLLVVVNASLILT